MFCETSQYYVLSRINDDRVISLKAEETIYIIFDVWK